MVKIALEGNTCEKKALLSSIACELFCVDLSTELGHATRVTNQSIFVERKCLDRSGETLLLPQFCPAPHFGACE
jgi:hypothetical protein